MAHWDLLPTVEDLIADVVRDDGVDEATARAVLSSVGLHLGLYRDYYRDQWSMNGERQDAGAADALELLAREFLTR